ncbi:MAG: hypothetical protein BWK76_15150 [Desulfobulbaceae bacterium A2]|nr:MAG: hypothetical protein BWK76_15150 [Desulfobulbaceae bacterium A2]
MDYDQACEYLDGLQFFKIKLGLESMADLLGRLGHPEQGLRFLHVAGTNGKGSVAAALTSLLGAAGLRVGLYTSPHLSSVRERFRVGQEYIPPQEFAREASRIRTVLGAGPITYFEFTTALALLWFASRQVDMVVLEVGLGGRLDATNVITPLVSIITNVGMDHEQYLGHSLGEIAVEKGGIVKPGVPLVSGALRSEAQGVIAAICAVQGAPRYLLGQDFFAAAEPGQDPAAPVGSWQYHGVKSPLDGSRRVWRALPQTLPGSHQRDNAAVALATLELLHERGIPLAEDQVRRGLADLRWPGRLEEFWRDGEGVLLHAPPDQAAAARFRHYLLDGAHNPDGVRSLCDHLQDTATRRARLILVWAAMADKALAQTLLPVAALADKILLTRPDSERAAVPSSLMALLPPRERARANTLQTVRDALRAAAIEAGPQDLICVAGSLYLVGEARELLCGALAP